MTTALYLYFQIHVRLFFELVFIELHSKKRGGVFMEFSTNYTFHDRESKSRYVYLKYKSILTGKILDVGADECHLKKHLSGDVAYTGIGLDLLEKVKRY